MSTEALRRLFLVSALFNVAGAALFAFPAAGLGPWLGLPAEVPLLYRAFTADFVLLFAGLYLWLARTPEPPPPVVLFAAVGKGSAFALIALLWLTGLASGRTVMVASGDLLLALLYLAWWRDR